MNGYCPRNKIVKTIKNIINAVEKFDGNINITTNRIGNHNGTNEDFKSNFLLIFFDKKFEIYISKKIDEKNNILGPKSIYGLTKLSSEMFIEEFSYAFGIRYLINRCGVISGPLQFGKQDQGFISLWIWKHLNKQKLKYIGYGGHGNQVRDVLHIKDLCNLILIQIKKINKIYNKLYTVGGSSISYTSLKNLTNICQKVTKNKIKFSKQKKTSIYDIPYYITNNSLVSKTYKWKPKKNIYNVVMDTYIWLSNNKNNLKKYF